MEKEEILNKINIYTMSCDSFEAMEKLPALVPFSDEVMDFLSELSDKIRKDVEAKKNPVIQTFAFFIRKANLIQLKNRYFHLENNINNNDNKKNDNIINDINDVTVYGRIGKGLSLHIAPSNVPINFAYTLVSGLLAGNPCIVRASSKDFDETRIICRLISEIKNSYSEIDSKNDDDLQECSRIAGICKILNYISVISYSHDKDITDYLSSLVNVRVIWGGDNTIAEIRKSPIPPRCTEVCFADRYSLLLIDAAFFSAQFEANEKYGENIAKAFYNDTYLFDQNACGSPRLIYWYGRDAVIEKAKGYFWKSVNDYLNYGINSNSDIASKINRNLDDVSKKRYEVQPVIAVDKLNMSYVTSVEVPGSSVVQAEDNNIVRVELSSLDTFPEGKTIADYRCAGGFFLEYSSDSLEGLKDIVDERFQTLTYICRESKHVDNCSDNEEADLIDNNSEKNTNGILEKDIKNYIISNGLKGIDRVVPVGHSADFDLIWDGYDLIDYYTRVVY